MVAKPPLDEESIFKVAVEISSQEARRQYLHQVCGDDQALRARLATLLGAHDEAPDFLEPSPNVLATHEFPMPMPGQGTLVGPYKLREQIGEGGMGVVYVAEQTEPVRRKVALKLIKPGMTTRDVVARFEAERQALAMMDHPNIARVLDAGATTSGQPYFVMELVQGPPITEYCDKEKLSITDRVKLFSKVCRAVQHAHQKGIIHRDIKPSNVLAPEIDGEPVPKVIDFGVAKAVSQRLTEQTVYTQFAQVVGTPLYMSPEQAAKGVVDIDTRSDVYSLGVLLYELLTGDTPFDRASLEELGFDEFRRRLREDDARRPSDALSTLKAAELSTICQRRSADPRKLTQSVRGELDWIVTRALEKDRNRRYESASALAADIDRHLHSQPIDAGPPSVSYRVRKFLQRNRGRLIAAALVSATIAVGLTLAVHTHLRQSHKRRQLTQDVQQSLVAARAMIASGDLAAAEQQAAVLRGRLADADQDVTRLDVSFQQLTNEIEQRKEQQQRFDRFDQLARDAMDDIVYDKDGIDGDKTALEALGLYGILGDDRSSKRKLETYLSAVQRNHVRQTAYELLLVLADHGVRWHQSRNVDSVNDSLRYLKVAEGLREPTRAFYWVRGECHKFLENEVEAKQDLTQFQVTAAETPFDHFLPGRTAAWRGDVKEAIRSFKAALRIRPDHFNSLFFLAMRLSTEGRETEAAQVYRACMALRPDHVPSIRNRAGLLAKQGELEEALELVNKAIEIRGRTPTGVYAFLVRADIHVKLKKLEEALADYDEALRIHRNDGGPPVEVDKVSKDRAKVYRLLGRTDEALEELDALVERVPTERRKHDHFHVFTDRATVLVDKKDFVKALADIDAAPRIAEESSEVPVDCVARAHWGRFKILVGLDRRDEAVAESYKIIEKAQALPTTERAQVHNNLAWFLAALPDSAVQDIPRALGLAGMAVQFVPDESAYWNTFGVVQYRAGMFVLAVQSLKKAMELDSAGNYSGVNALFLAMAHWQLGEQDEARRWYERAVQWMNDHEIRSTDEFHRFRAEAEALLGVET